jgi:hypothetical protein
LVSVFPQGHRMIQIEQPRPLIPIGRGFCWWAVLNPRVA